MRLFSPLIFAIAFASHTSAPESKAIQRDVIVYGGTPAGIMAAIAAARQGHTVALVDLNGHIGGMVSGGLVATDMGDRKTVGGLADNFFKRIVKYYSEKYGADSKELKACRLRCGESPQRQLARHRRSHPLRQA